MSHLYYCTVCKEYTLDNICNKCGEKTKSKNPPRYSPQDRLGKYRRELKRQNKGV